MRPAQLKEALKTGIKARRPIMIHGSPGTGKSDLVHQVAKELDYEVIDLRLSQLDPVDLRGVPSVTKGVTSWNKPSFLPTSGKFLIFFDEINSAPQATQAAAYQLILDRKLGDYTLPEECVMVAAGNLMTDRAIVNQMSTALKNRFIHVYNEVHNDDWCSWALDNDVHTHVLSFIRFRPQLLNEFEQRDESKEEHQRLLKLKDQNAIATPRTWKFVSDIMKVDTPSYEFIKGIVGDGPGIEFHSFLKLIDDMPNLDALLLDPKGTPVPEDNMAVCYAIATGLASKVTADNFERAMQYIERMPIEFQVVNIKDSQKRAPKIVQSKAFTKWALDNQEVLL